ncbi:hypothetical protein FGO68_gene2623 [Halteria grandinella]|uniref:Uncharacterized protein n=1 Tax=Halteria grandinella TaxID=5974 RepID=A0A8J8T9B6_HALGN|nr:hypothetical protein FGO68_gene2623 [Halteria grandinella]
MWGEFGDAKQESNSNSDKEDAFGNVWGEGAAQENEEEEFDDFQGADAGGWAANVWTANNPAEPAEVRPEPLPQEPSQEDKHSSTHHSSHHEEQKSDDQENWAFAEPISDNPVQPSIVDEQPEEAKTQEDLKSPIFEIPWVTVEETKQEVANSPQSEQNEGWAASQWVSPDIEEQKECSQKHMQETTEPEANNAINEETIIEEDSAKVVEQVATEQVEEQTLKEEEKEDAEGQEATYTEIEIVQDVTTVEINFDQPQLPLTEFVSQLPLVEVQPINEIDTLLGELEEATNDLPHEDAESPISDQIDKSDDEKSEKAQPEQLQSPKQEKSPSAKSDDDEEADQKEQPWGFKEEPEQNKENSDEQSQKSEEQETQGWGFGKEPENVVQAEAENQPELKSQKSEKSADRQPEKTWGWAEPEATSENENGFEEFKEAANVEEVQDVVRGSEPSSDEVQPELKSQKSEQSADEKPEQVWGWAQQEATSENENGFEEFKEAEKPDEEPAQEWGWKEGNAEEDEFEDFAEADESQPAWGQFNSVAAEQETNPEEKSGEEEDGDGFEDFDDNQSVPQISQPEFKEVKVVVKGEQSKINTLSDIYASKEDLLKSFRFAQYSALSGISVIDFNPTHKQISSVKYCVTEDSQELLTFRDLRFVLSSFKPLKESRFDYIERLQDIHSQRKRKSK